MKSVSSPGFNQTITYSATGQKLIVTTNGASRTYIDGAEFEGTQLRAIYHEHGRIYYPSSGTPRHEYSLKDHLGNTRVTFTDKNGDGIITQSSDPNLSEMLSEHHYYPFGMEMDGPWKQNTEYAERYRYNGKEFDASLRLYDYGARMYDPAAGRWLGVDPLASKYPGWSPYNYVMNNPISNTDPDGRQVVALGDDDYKSRVLNTMITLAWNSDRGAQMVNSMISSKHTFVFASMPGVNNQVFKDSDNNGYTVTAFNFDQAESLVSSAEYSGDDREQVSAAVAMGHESSHMLSDETRQLIGHDGRQSGINADEVNAVADENRVRHDFGVSARKDYGGIDVYGQKLAPSSYDGWAKMVPNSNYASPATPTSMNPIGIGATEGQGYRIRGGPVWKLVPSGSNYWKYYPKR